MRHGIIFKATDGTTRFITPSGRMYIWAYGAWRFKVQMHDATYKMFRRAARLKDSKVFVARIQQNAAVAFGKSAHQSLTGSAYWITPTPFYAHKIRPPKIHK